MVKIELHRGRREELRRLFELAEDSPSELDSYVDLGRVEPVSTVLVATAAADIGNLRFYQRQGLRMRSIERDAFTDCRPRPSHRDAPR